MSEIKKINGKNIKDEIARNDIEEIKESYAKKEYVDEAIDSELTAKKYATESFVQTAIDNAQLSGGDGETIDMTKYALKTDVPSKTSQLTNDSGYITSVPSEYITETELNAKGYLTQHQDLSAYAKKTDIPSVPTEISQLINDSGYVIESRVIELINLIIGDNGGDNTPIEKPCTNITLNKSLLIFSDNNAQTLTATVTPSDTTDTIVWRSSDILVATVEDGVVTPNSDGSCIITVTCGSKSVVCNITVNIEQTEVQNAIILSQNSIVAENIGGNILISALLDESLEGKAIEWNSSDTNVATVVNYSLTSGLIVPKGKGTCEIIATCGGYKATCVVKVEPKELGDDDDDTGDDNTGDDNDTPINIPCTAISLSPKSYTFTQIGEKTMLLPTYTPYNTTDIVLWTSSNTAVAKVESGEVTCVGEGVCVITVYCGNYSDSCTVVANIPSTPPSDPTNIPCTGVSINPSSYTFTSIGQQVQLSATIQPSNTTDTVSWSSSNPGIATVNNGRVTSMSNGETIITVQCGYYLDTTLITVQDESTSGSSDTLTGFSLSSDFNVNSKNYYRVEAIPVPSTFSGEYTVWWTSSDPAVLSPSSSSGRNMTFYPGKSGTCIMTVTVDAGLKGYYRKKFDVTVNIPDNAPTTNILYSNPTITVENFKAKAVQGNVVQYFDVSYEPNTGNPSYVRSLELIDDNGQKCYLALLNRGTSPFGVDGLHLDSGAWITEASESSGVPYHMLQSALSWQNFDKTIRVRNVNNTVDSQLLSTAIFNASQAFPDINYVIDNSSRNTIELVPNMDDQWLGQTSLNDDRTSFKIILNERYFHKIYGPLNSSTFNLWLSTVVHELGHALGTTDNASHHPTLFSYNRNIAACTYLQPNDIAWIKYLHKEMYGVELQTIQEKTQP